MKLSVITVNLNNAAGLEKTILSVISQTYDDFEYLIIDGFSTDNSKEIIEKYNDRITFWTSETDSGIYNAMNKGIRAANGEYCLFLNSGDTLYNNTILKETIGSESTEDIMYGNILMSDGAVYEYPDEVDITVKYFINATLPHPCTFIKKQLFSLVGFYNENNRISSDWEFFLLAICKFNATIRHLNCIVSIYDLAGLSSDPSNQELISNEKDKALKHHFPRLVKDYYLLQSYEHKLARLRKNTIFRSILFFQKITGSKSRNKVEY